MFSGPNRSMRGREVFGGTLNGIRCSLYINPEFDFLTRDGVPILKYTNRNLSRSCGYQTAVS